MKKIWFLFLFLFFLSAVLPAGEKFFENGLTAWAVDTGASDHSTIRYAEKELKNTLFKISGAIFPSSGTAKHRIILKVDSRMPADQISIQTQNGNLLLSGGSERSVLYAAYTFLQKYLGVRWLWPGESGEFIPKKKNWELPDINFSYTPGIKYRSLQETGGYTERQEEVRDWFARNFISTCPLRSRNYRDRERGFHITTGAHFGVPKSYFKEHPEYFAITNGIRHSEQFCFSNKDAIRIVADQIARTQPYGGSSICGIIPNDNAMLCQCRECSGKKGSNQWFSCFEQIVQHLKKLFPNTEFYTMAYMGFMSPPSIKNVSPFTRLGTFRRCNIHKYSDENCPANQREKKWREEWRKSGARLSFYNYDYCLFSWNMAVFAPFYSVIDDALKTAAHYKSDMVSTEIWQGAPTQPLRDVEYMKNRLSVYLYAQLMWNPQADCDELIRDWCQTAYGKGGDPLYRYFKLLDKQWTSMKIHHGIHGRASNIAPHFITPELCAEVRSLFLEADRLNGGKTDAVEYEKYLFGQWMSLTVPDPKIILPRVKENAAGANAISNTSVRAGWNGSQLLFHEVKLPFEAEITLPFVEKPFRFSVDGKGKKSSDPVLVSEWEWNNNTVSIPLSVFQSVPEPGIYWGLRFRSGSGAWPSRGISHGFMVFSDKEFAGRKIFWAKGDGTYGDAYDLEMKNQFLKMGWDFNFATKEKFEQEDFSVYFFYSSKAQYDLSPEMWQKIWKQVNAGAMLVIQPPSNMNFGKITDDETLHCRTRGMGKTPMGRTPEYLKGEWLHKPYDLQREFKRCITPAYTALPKHPEAWQILANQPRSFEEKNIRDPFVLFRPYGKGYVVVFCFVNYGYFSPAVLIGNLYENREALRGKSL